MTDTKNEKQNVDNDNATAKAISLPGLYGFKEQMTQVVDEKGDLVGCTVVRFEPMVVSQIKTSEKDGYEAVQVSFSTRKAKRSPKSQLGHLKKTGSNDGSYFVREFRTKLPDGVGVGSPVNLGSLKKGDVVKVTSVSKGKGFAGSVKRWNVGGGPAAHGSCFHRQPGSSGNRTWPGRIMKGKAFPGHLGDEAVTVKNLRVLEVLSDDNLLILSGAIPGSRNTLVRINKQM